MIDSLIRAYSPAKNRTIFSEIKDSNVPKSLMHKLQNTMKQYLSTEICTSTQVDICVSQLLQITKRPRLLADVILLSIQNTGNEKFSIKPTPPAPLLRPVDQKCVVLVLRLASHMPQFDRYIHMEIERKIFKLKSLLTSGALINLMYFCIALLDIDTEQPRKCTNVRLLIYKCMYYYKRLSSAFVYAILMAYPKAIPHASDTKSYDDPLVRTFASIMANETYLTNNDDVLLKKQEMFYFLKIRYGYFALISFPLDETVSYCIECIQHNHLKNVDYALILIGKRKGWEWAMKSIVEGHLVPMLGKYMSNVTTDDHDQQIRSILFTIASILKTIPCDQNIEQYLNMFTSVLDATNRKVLQEAAVSALCQLARFSYSNVHAKIAKWKPEYEVDHTVKAMLLTFVHRKHIEFWFEH